MRVLWPAVLIIFGVALGMVMGGVIIEGVHRDRAIQEIIERRSLDCDPHALD